MTIQYINTGTSSNAGNGDSIRTAFTKVNQNFDFLNGIVLGTGSNFNSSVQSVVNPMLVHGSHRGISAQYNSVNNQIVLSLDTGVFDNIIVVNTATLKDVVSTGTITAGPIQGTDDISLVKFANTGSLNLRVRNTFGSGNSSLALVDSNTGSFIILHQNSSAASGNFLAGQNYIYDNQGRAINVGRNSDINFYSNQPWSGYTTPALSIRNTGTVFVSSTLTLAQSQLYAGGKLVEFGSNNVRIDGLEISGAGDHLTAGSFTATLTTSGNFVLPGNTVLEYGPYIPPGLTVTNYGSTFSTDGPFSGVGSIYFDGSSRIEVSGGQHFDLNTGSYTIEWYQKPTAFNTSSVYTVFILGSLTDQTLQANNSFQSTTTVTTAVLEGAYQLSAPYTTNILNTWSHVAIVQTATSFSVYVNGVETFNQSPGLVPTPVSTSSDLIIGAAKLFSSYVNTFTGYISNMRWEARQLYTTSFTPPASILTATSSTRLLLAAENLGTYLLDTSGSVPETLQSLTFRINTSTLKLNSYGELTLSQSGAHQSVYQAMNDANDYLKMGINSVGTGSYYGDNIAPRDAYVHIDGSTSTLHIGGAGDLKFWSEESTGGYWSGSTATLVMSKLDRTSTFGGHILPAADVTYDLGSSTQRFRDLYLSTTTLYFGTTALSVDGSGLLSVSEVIGGGEGIGGIAWIEWTTGSNLLIRTTDTSEFISKFDSLKSGDTFDLLTGADGNFAPGTVLQSTGLVTKTLVMGGGYYDFEIPVDSSTSTNIYVYTFNLVRAPVTDINQLSDTSGLLAGGGGGTVVANALTSGTSALVLNSQGYLTLDQEGAYDGVEVPGTLFRIDTNAPNYTQVTLHNRSNATTATSDIIFVRNDGDVIAATGILDIGINSSNYAEPTPFGIHEPGSAYMFTNDADLVIGTQTPGTRLVFHASGTDSTDAAGILDAYAWRFNRNVQVVVPTPGPLNFTVWNTRNDGAAQAMYQAINDAGQFLQMGINSSNAGAQYGSIGPKEAFVHIDGSTATLHIGSGGDLKFWSDEATGGYENGTTATLVMSRLDRSSTFGGHVLPAADLEYDLGSSSTQWRSLYVGTGTIYINNVPLTIDTNNNLTVNGNPVVVGLAPGNTATNLVLTNSAIVYPEPFVGSPVSFTKTDYGNEVDQISQYLHITRGEQYGIYNPVRESGWDGDIGYVDQGKDSPKGTMWNIDGWNDLTNLASRTYQTFYIISGNNNLGNWVPYQEWVMHDTINDKYYKFEFVQSAAGWGSGGRLSYTRTQLDPVTGDPIGSPVSFTRLSGHPETVDVIDTGLTIARANNYPWYNGAQETEYSFNDNTLYDSPLGSEWNDDGWHDLHSVSERTYSKFYDINDHQLGYEVLNKKFVMHDIVADKYYTVQFTSWTQNGNGGGFSYVRQEINRSHYFIHTANGNEVDDLAPNVGITRGSNGFVYNPYTEGGWDSQISPEGTLWNVEGWENIDNITSRTYLPLFEAIGGYGAGEKVPHRKYILYVPSTGDYYAVDWIYWANGYEDPGGGFVYKRYPIDLANVSEGVTFADGTVQTTAYQPDLYRGEKSRVVSKAFGAWKIIETSGSAEVGVSAKTYGISSTATSWTDRNDAYITANWDTDLFNLYQDNTKKIEFSLDGGVSYFEVDRAGYWNTNYMNFYRMDGRSMTTTINQVLTYREVTGGDAVRWFNTDVDNFRGAIIEFQAYSYYSNGSIIGTIHISDQDYNITHAEVTGGGSNLSNVDIWYRNPNAPYANQTEIWFRRLDGNHDTVRIHWTAKIFTGLGN